MLGQSKAKDDDYYPVDDDDDDNIKFCRRDC